MELAELQQKLREVESTADESRWPQEALTLLTMAGVWGNTAPAALGGKGADTLHKVRTYGAVAGGSLTTALILTQHDAACELLAGGENRPLAELWLPDLARGNRLATVGISQLTTSRRHGAVAMQARSAGHGFALNGVMPWVTSAGKADVIVTGAITEDGRQLLGLLDIGDPGVCPGEPMELMALRSSWTSEVRCQDVKLPPERLIRGPAERVLAHRAPVKPLTVSATGLGFAAGLLDAVRELAPRLPESVQLLEETITPCFEQCRRRLHDAARSIADPEADVPAAEIRAGVNDLVSRLALTLMTLVKGSGYLSSHRAQRLVREAMFFLVWSAPVDVQMSTLRNLWAERNAK